MIQGTAEFSQLLDWGVAERTLAGEAESGDNYLVHSFQHGVLLAVVDGLGHGPEAAAAALAAVATLTEHAHETLPDLVRHCHESLRRTRGAVMSLACFHGSGTAMTWLGVGDVDGVLLKADAGTRKESLLMRGGVVGYQLPTLRPSQLSVEPGDVLILATDGIRHGFAETLNLSDSPQQIADHILAEHGRGTDDALVLVARFLGQKP